MPVDSAALPLYVYGVKMKRPTIATILLFLLLAGLPGSVTAQSTSYPGAVDTTTTLCNPTPTAATNGACKDAELATSQNNAIEAVEAKVGTGASTPQAGSELVGTGLGTSAFASFTPTPNPSATFTPLPTETPASTATPRATDTPIPAPTLAPTYGAGIIVEGTGGQGTQAGSMALTTATPIAGCSLYDAVGGAGSVINCATVLPAPTQRATDTPIPAPTLVATSTPVLAFNLTGRGDYAQGAAVASANNLTLGTDGNYFEISGTTTVNGLCNTSWQGGSHIALYFQGVLTLTNNAGGLTGCFKPILLSRGANMTTAAGFTVSLWYDSTLAAWTQVNIAATDTPIPAPTAIPTCAAGQYYAGLGYSCVTPVPTPAVGAGNPSYVPFSTGSANIVQNATQFFGTGGGANTTEAVVQTALAIAHTFTNLYCTISTAPGVGTSHTITLRANAVSKLLTCSISGASATGCNDTAHTYAASAGDLLDIQDVTTAVALSTVNCMLA